MELNRAIALAMRDGPQAGLRAIDKLMDHEDLQHYHLLYAARADLLRRLHQLQDASLYYRRALSLTQQEPERRFLRQRLALLEKAK
ncbi:hypothetical protein DBV39_14615 [Orrella marina]|uniref:RNA polymerase subunit sigma-24 n=1 Tax=Orrella marina TaxID=2163011 RepID=A0A2R4XLS1_9BURK|nr:hypothetical protein DBV39_14615 [Orrella marina]